MFRLISRISTRSLGTIKAYTDCIFYCNKFSKLISNVITNKHIIVKVKEGKFKTDKKKKNQNHSQTSIQLSYISYFFCVIGNCEIYRGNDKKMEWKMVTSHFRLVENKENLEFFEESTVDFKFLLFYFLCFKLLFLLILVFLFFIFMFYFVFLVKKINFLLFMIIYHRR